MFLSGDKVIIVRGNYTGLNGMIGVVSEVIIRGDREYGNDVVIIPIREGDKQILSSVSYRTDQHSIKETRVELYNDTPQAF